MDLSLKRADFSDPALARLVDTHADFCDATAPAESCHRLPLSALDTPDIDLWVARDKSGGLLGMGALSRLSATEGELKSMHVTAAARGRGVARCLLEHLTAQAQAQGLTSLWLETGAHPLFGPARALYAQAGFAVCPPFGPYVEDPHSVFMTRKLPEGAEL